MPSIVGLLGSPAVLSMGNSGKAKALRAFPEVFLEVPLESLSRICPFLFFFAFRKSASYVSLFETRYVSDQSALIDASLGRKPL